MGNTNKGNSAVPQEPEELQNSKNIGTEEIDKMIVLSQTLPVMFETDEGKWELRPMTTKVLVSPDFFKDKKGIRKASFSYAKEIKKEYEKRGLKAPPMQSIEYRLTEKIDEVRDLPIDELSEEELLLIIAHYADTPDTEERRNEKRAIVNRGRISASLARGISARKDATLFDTLEEKNKLKLQDSDNENYIDRKGRQIVLTKRQTKIIYALQHYVSQFITDEDVLKYSLALDRNPQGAIKNKALKVERVLDLREFFRYYLSFDEKAPTKNVRSLREEIKEISEIKQVLYIGDGNKKFKFISPLITALEELEEDAPDNPLSIYFMNIRFSPLFLHKIHKEYAPIVGPRLFKLWGKKGNGTDTELFSILLSDLLSKYPYKRQTALTMSSKIKRKDYRTKEEYLDAVDKAKREALSYKQTLYTLRDRIPTDYSSKKQYVYNFKRDLDNALRFYRDEMGLITEYDTQSKDTGGELSLLVVFNENYTQKSLE